MGGRLLRGWRVTVDSREILRLGFPKKMSSTIFGRIMQKNLEGGGKSNQRSAPGGRNPSYATENVSNHIY